MWPLCVYLFIGEMPSGYLIYAVGNLSLGGAGGQNKELSLIWEADIKLHDHNEN